MFRFATLDDVEVAGQRVLVRADLNVPLEYGHIGDDFRIRSALPTISKLRESDAVVIVCSHLGRPKGIDPALSMKPVAKRMEQLAGYPITMVDAVIGETAQTAVAEAEPGDVLVLENTRFEAGETKNADQVADGLAELCDLFVEDAFGSVHRAHASTVGVAERVRSVAGPLLTTEVRSLQRFLEDPDRPYVVILGGSKISDKLGVMRNLLPRVDSMLIGGAMCFTALKAQGHAIGSSLVEEDQVAEIRNLLDGPDGSKMILPSDIVVADSFAEDAENRIVPADAIPDGWMGLDIGPESSQRFADEIAAAASIFWNGPMGVFEWEAFRHGTETVATALAEADGFTAVGGGDSAAALKLLGADDDVSHLSTGGGAGLEMLEGRDLPGVTVLERWADTNG